VTRRKHPDHRGKAALPPARRRVALTLANLRMACPDLGHRTRTELANSILALVDGEDRRLPQKTITDAQAVEMVWRHSQCVLNQTGRCPLLVFGRQLSEEINQCFSEDE
jgi:hypothetical protein